MKHAEPFNGALMAADLRARSGFYKAIVEEARDAFRRGQELPVMPPNDELTFVDGFLVWKGRPVWYSGEGRGAVAALMDGPGFVETGILAGAREVPHPSSGRPGLRRWLRLRWNALAYGHAL